MVESSPGQRDTSPLSACELCESTGGELVASHADYRVIRAKDADFPAFYRVIWNAHVAEFSDLEPESRARCMAAVVAVESVLRRKLNPTKVNLAALGNMVAHLHWHVIARFDWDSHFPQPIWGVRQRELDGAAVERLSCPLDTLDQAVREALVDLHCPASLR